MHELKQALKTVFAKSLELNLKALILAPIFAIGIFPIVLIAKQLFNVVVFYWNLF